LFSLIFSLYRFSAGNLRENCEAKSSGQRPRRTASAAAEEPEPVRAAAAVIYYPVPNQQVCADLRERATVDGFSVDGDPPEAEAAPVSQ